MRASTLSVLASWPVVLARSRERRGLTTATAKPLSWRLRWAFAVELAGGLHGDEGDGESGEAALELNEPDAHVRDAERLTPWVHIDVEPVFTDIDSSSTVQTQGTTVPAARIWGRVATLPRSTRILQ
jgi:hypothetical protein